jgi:aspartyl-tRNA(Asn)/glutamyl-tRNA(Gln) amidotransferase subunit B
MSGCKIGLETHIQLNTKSKLFCACPTKNSNQANSQTCPICLGHPGTKPMLNRQALHFALKLGVALGCEIEREIAFSRKTYFYPDMGKNFQITQHEIPLGRRGSVKLKSGKVIDIERIHLEEDPAALVHEEGMNQSAFVLIDYNRSGIPLCEIVTTPCMTSPAEAREFLKELVKIVKYLKVFDENEGVLKADLNLSIPGHPRVEIKNVSGFKDAERALNYDLIRQKMSVKMKKKAVMETRAWDGSKTFSLRSKETEADYGYIIEPDLPVITISEEMIKSVSREVPELAHVRSSRYVKEHNLDPIDAEVMATEIELAELFERVALKIDARLAARWLRHELLAVLHYNKKSLKQVKMDETHVIELLSMLDKREISESTGQDLMRKLVDKPFSPKDYVHKHGLAQITSSHEIKKLCNKIIKDNSQAVADFKSGNKKSFHYLVGQVMRVTKGKASPDLVNKVMEEELTR